MTMFPAHRHLEDHKNLYGGAAGYGGGCGDGGGGYLGGDFDTFVSLEGANSDLMADEEAGSSSKDIHQDDDPGWLQLSLGGAGSAGAGDGARHVQSTSHEAQLLLGPRLVELDLLPGSSSGVRRLDSTAPPRQLSFQVPDYRSLPSTTAAQPAFFWQHHRGAAAAAAINSVPAAMNLIYDHQQIQENNYFPFRPLPPSNHPSLSTPSSFSGSFEQLSGSGSGFGLSSYHGRPALHGGVGVAGPPPTPPSMHLRVVAPPRRPHSGVWFMLQASQNQAKEPFLPQVPKSYLRIKDGRTTVGLLIKYLVNKLKLDSEFEIEITCKGQQLLPILTLQHVRDQVWNSPRNDVVLTMPPHSSATTDHFMVLNYGRIA